MEENRARINLGAIRPKINVLKTKVRCNIRNNRIKDLKRNSSNIQTSKSR
jgi:hypothetical protein